VVPLRIGSGTRIKILHGMALGLPIVTTSLGCEGIDVTDGQELWVRDRPEDFATATLDLIRDADRRQQFRQKGRELVEQHYDWAAIFAAAIDRFEAENPVVP
jgi:glycosyltransferase involved in cell wall biosynthesis